MNKISLQSVSQNHFQGNKKPAQKEKSPVNIQNQKFELPSYNLSFGMAKIIRCNVNSEFTLPYSELKEINSIYCNHHNHEITDCKCENIFPDFNEKSVKAIMHYLKGYENEINFKYLGSGYVSQFLDAVSKIEDESKKMEVLKRAFFNKAYNNASDDNFITSIVDSDYSGVNFAKSLKLFEDQPVYLAKLLSFTDSEGNTAAVKLKKYSEDDSADSKDSLAALQVLSKVNELIYDLTTQTEEVSVEASEDLLSKNEAVLDSINKNVLLMFKGKAFEAREKNKA